MRRSIILITAATAMIGLSALLAAADNIFAEEVGPVAFEVSAMPDMDIAVELAAIPLACLAEVPVWREEGSAVRHTVIQIPSPPAAGIDIAKLQPELWRWPKRVG